MSLNLGVILRASACTRPDATAIVAGDTEISYATLHQHAQRLAGALAQLGVRRGQHVALMLPNVPQFSVAYFATLYAGATVVPLNVLFTPDEIAYHLQDSNAVALIVWEGFIDQATAAADRVDACAHVIVARADPADTSAPDGAHSLAALVASGQPVLDLPDTMPDDTAVILYTSGTTGRPKGAELTHFNMFYNADYMASKLLGLSPATTSLATLPLFHSFGQSVVHNGTLIKGGKLVLLPRFEPTAALQAMTRHGVTLFAGVPTMYFALLHHPEADQYDLSALQCCLSGGAAMPVEVMKAFDAKYGVNILEGYGLSETSPVASFNVLDQPKKPGSIGVPIWGVEFRLIDQEGAVIDESGVAGEICIKGHNIMKGYYERPDATAEVIRDGWFRTGDVGTRDADGYYFIVDRIKDMIIRGGYNVYPREIEECLYAHPAIAEAAVIGVPDERNGEEVVAVVALKPGAQTTEDALRDHCKQHLAAYKYPRRFEFRDSLPKGPTGKLLKRVLRTEMC